VLCSLVIKRGSSEYHHAEYGSVRLLGLDEVPVHSCSGTLRGLGQKRVFDSAGIM
jgi:hypothetical protein